MTYLLMLIAYRQSAWYWIVEILKKKHYICVLHFKLSEPICIHQINQPIADFIHRRFLHIRTKILLFPGVWIIKQRWKSVKIDWENVFHASHIKSPCMTVTYLLRIRWGGPGAQGRYFIAFSALYSGRRGSVFAIERPISMFIDV